MKIMQVNIQNFRNIPDLTKDINGANIILLGENGVGKSNFIKAIEIALGMTSAAGVDQVTHGKKEAIIRVVADDNGIENTFEVKFKDGKPVITVTAPNGLKTTNKGIIAELVGSIDFDPYKFVEMSKTEKGRKEQVDLFKTFLSADERETIRKLENKVQLTYDDRTEVNRQIKTMEGFIRESGLSEDEKDKYFLKIDSSKLTEEMNKAIEQNKLVQKAEDSVKQIEELVQRNDLRVIELQKEMARLQSENEDKVAQLQKIAAWQHQNKPVDISELQTKISAATEHNLMHQKVNDVRTQEMKVEELKKESENLTVMVETTRQLISDTIKDLQSPVPGLSYTDTSLTYNGKIVDESTLSTSEIMMLGVMLKRAKNPKAPLFIERGESLGAKKLADLQEMSKKYDFQIILEEVKRGQENLTIELLPL